MDFHIVRVTTAAETTEAVLGAAENEDRGMGCSILRTLRGAGRDNQIQKRWIPLGHLMLV